MSICQILKKHKIKPLRQMKPVPREKEQEPLPKPGSFLWLPEK